MKVAVCIDATGQVQALAGQGQIGVYHYVDAEREWQRVALLPFDFATSSSLEAMRPPLLRLLAQLQEAGCRDLVVRQMHGFVRAIIDGCGLMMWRLDGPVLPALQQIRAAAAQRAEPVTPAGGGCRGRHSASQGHTLLAPEQQASCMPLPTDDGVPGSYAINLALSLAVSGMNSQQLLLPFLREQPFSQLHLRCAHPPRWLEPELERLGLQLQRLPDEATLIHLLVTSDPAPQ